MDDVDLVVALALETPFNGETQFGKVAVCLMVHFFKELIVHDKRWVNRSGNPRRFTQGKCTVSMTGGGPNTFLSNGVRGHGMLA